MLSSISLRGIKSFESDSALRCAPLTILTGSNSSGKSTIIQALLLLKQLVEVRAGSAATVRLSGPLVAQGSYRDWSSNHASGPLSLGVGLVDGEGHKTSLKLTLEYTGGAPSDARLVRVEWSSAFGENGGTGQVRWHLSVPSTEEYASALAEALHAKDGAEGAAVDGGLQPTAVYPYQVSAVVQRHGIDTTIGTGICSIAGLLPARVEAEGHSEEALLWLLERSRRFPSELADPALKHGSPTRLGGEFGKFFHLGPLRDEPRLIYGGERARNPQDLGRRGERAASVLAEFGSEIVDAPLSELVPGSHGQTLAECVSEWAAYIGVLTKLGVETQTKFGTEFRVAAPFSADTPATAPIETDVVNVGIGVSQVIPVLILCLSAPPGATIILEQPELHLHPAVQSRLGDFFVACVLSGRQLLVETHSEHIINRLRLLTARRILNPSSVSVNFVERDRFGSEVTEIPLREDGSFSRWPRGFFDETQRALEDIVRGRLT